MRRNAGLAALGVPPILAGGLLLLSFDIQPFVGTVAAQTGESETAFTTFQSFLYGCRRPGEAETELLTERPEGKEGHRNVTPVHRRFSRNGASNERRVVTAR